MHLRTVLTVLSLVGVGSARFDQGAAPENPPLSRTKRFILELSKGSDFEKLTSDLVSREGTKLYKTFESDVFTGVSIETSLESAETLRLLQGVSNVWHSRMVQMAEVVNGQTFGENTSASNYSIHGMTGVDKFHEAGILGKGVKVAVVDAGIDYTHPALGGGFGPEFKVIGGYDLVGSSPWPVEGFDKTPDDDPYEEDSLGHGTHVSGILAGKSDSWQGVAPEANILSYKVFGGGDSGQTDEETLIEAFLMAYHAGADIITSSIGGRGGFSTNAWAEVASRLVDQGLVVTISAGNDGDGGIFYADNGMSGKHVLAVASLEPSSVPGMPFELTIDLDGDANTTMQGFFHGSLYHSFPTNSSGLPVVALSFDPNNDTVGCDVLPEDAPDLSGALVLVPRGGCSAVAKRYILFAAGAENVLLFNNENAFPTPTNWETRGVEGIISRDVGVDILDAMSQGANVTARFFNSSDAEVVNLENPVIFASSFTSMGGLYDLQIKPDIAAPGSNIYSTLPHKAYGVKSGTSMATPYVAGIAALYISKYGGRDVHGPDFGKRLAARIMSSGDSIRWNDGINETYQDTWAPIFQLGNGLVNATKVLNYHMELSWSKFALNDTAHHRASHCVMITNNCTVPITYNFSLQAAGGYEAIGDYAEINLGPPYDTILPNEMIPSVTFPKGEFKVEPGETKEAMFTFERPEGLNESAMPVYNGKILITGSNREELAVPYMGVGSDLQRNFEKMFMGKYPHVLSTHNSTMLGDKSTFTFDLSLLQQDFPRLSFALRWGAQVLRWDIFEGGWREEMWKYPPIVGKDGFVGMAATWNNERHATSFDPAMHDEMDLLRGPLGELSRGVSGYPLYEAWWLGRLADGSKIRPGNYTMRIAALTPFGDPARSEHWDIFSHEFRVFPIPKNTTIARSSLASVHH